MADYVYRVVSEHQDGDVVTTVQLGNRDYAERVWRNKGDWPDVKRTWIERQPIGDWEICSSEIGTEFLALNPAASRREGSDA